jgi:hypothetical protein
VRFAIGDDLLQHGRFDTELELHEQLDGLGLQFAVLKREQRIEMRLHKSGEGLFIARGGFVDMAVDAVEAWRMREGEQHVQRFALQLGRLQRGLNHGFHDAETQAGIQAATRVALCQCRERFGNAGVIVNGALGFIGESAVGEEISDAGTNADARGRAGSTTRFCPSHARQGSIRSRNRRGR